MSGIFSPTIECFEEHGSRQEGADQNGPTASVALRCSWAARWSLVQDLLLNRRPWPDGTFAGGSAPFAIGATIGNDGARGLTAGQELIYTDAVVAVTYGTLTQDDAPQGLAQESLEPHAEFLPIDPKNYTWTNAAGDPVTTEESPGRQTWGVNMVRTRYQLMAPLYSGLCSLVGDVNTESYTSPITGFVFAAGCLLYTGATIDSTYQSDGTPTFTATMRFSYKGAGWNTFWRAKTGNYQPMWNKTASATVTFYEDSDFSTLLS